MTLKSINPHNLTIIGTTKISTNKEVNEAVAQARKASDKWQEVSVDIKVGYIKKLQQLLIKNKEKIATLTSKEMGKPINQSRGDIDFEVGFLNYYINHVKSAIKEEVILKTTDFEFTQTYEPVGVVACIAPWNYPISMANSGIIPALLTGNTVVFKPSEYTTLTQKLLGELIWETKIPDGVFNMVYGGGEVGAMLVDSKIDLVWFTGSTKTGLSIFEKCGKKFIRSMMELGGSSPAIVFKDADIDQAVSSIYEARFSNCGQICTAIKRLLVEKPVFDLVVEKLIKKLKTVKVDKPMKEASEMGPLVSAKQLDLLDNQVKEAIISGAKVEIGGQRLMGKKYEKGNYFAPTLLTRVNLKMKVMSEEVFGPVLPVMAFKDEDEAVILANHTPYGLSAEIYTSDINKAERLVKRIKAGTVTVNTDDFFKPECPFGGVKLSGMGREYGKEGFKEFTNIKMIVKKWQADGRKA